MSLLDDLAGVKIEKRKIISKINTNENVYYDRFVIIESFLKNKYYIIDYDATEPKIFDNKTYYFNSLEPAKTYIEENKNKNPKFEKNKLIYRDYCFLINLAPTINSKQIEIFLSGNIHENSILHLIHKNLIGNKKTSEILQNISLNFKNSCYTNYTPYMWSFIDQCRNILINYNKINDILQDVSMSLLDDLVGVKPTPKAPAKPRVPCTRQSAGRGGYASDIIHDRFQIISLMCLIKNILLLITTHSTVLPVAPMNESWFLIM